ncbi:hypothetical protein EB796_009318 [Bugula neritina]|uniref:C2H2-type domain-containing protein n=1 Tax=Bugula neritina TaxID=10212 RepID=A0A7J7K471_BUGNE|nr:hypothetical protein EB796_009318 [Bugula neritina]
MGDVVLENTCNPFTQDRLTPEHLALLFPPKFYQNDDSLALHLSESCLVESTTWDGNIAIGDMAFWLKVLSTPQTEYLKQQKRAFKSRVAEMCRDIQVKDGRPVAKKLHTEAQDSPPKPVVQQLKMTASNILMKSKPTLTTVLVVDSSAGEDQSKPKASNQITQLTLDAVASPTPGFGLNSYKCTTCDFATDTRERLNHHQKMAHAVGAALQL